MVTHENINMAESNEVVLILQGKHCNIEKKQTAAPGFVVSSKITAAAFTGSLRKWAA